MSVESPTEAQFCPDAALARRDRLESQAMGFGLAALVVGLIVVAVHTLMQPAPPTKEDLQRAVIASGFDRAICPDGWAASHAEYLDLTEAEISAWYVAESFRASDEHIINEAKAFFENPRDYRWIEGMALTVTQIKLCVAESRRLL
jgi:hypothetical protein